MKKFTTRLSLRTKLLGCVGLAITAALAVSLYSVNGMGELGAEMRDQVSASSARLDEARQVTISLANMRSAIRGVTLFSLTHRSDMMAKARAAFESASGQMRAATERLQASGLTAEEASQVSAIRAGLDQWAVNFEEFNSLLVAGRPDEADRLIVEKTTPLMDTIQKNAVAFGEANRSRHVAALNHANDTIRGHRLISFAFAAVTLLGGFGALLIVISLVQDLKTIAAAVAAGADQVAQASSEVAAVNQSFARGAS
jgi:hypothetical protein